MKIHIPACIALAIALMSTTVSGQVYQNQRVAAPQQQWQVPVVQASTRQEPALAVQSNATPAPAMNGAYNNVVGGDCCPQQCDPCQPERYLMIFGGAATFNDIGFNITATDPAGATTDLSAILEQNNGWTIGGGIGRRFRKRLRGELEWSYRNASLNSATLALNGQPQANGTLDGQINVYRSMSNVLFDLNPCGRINAYFGGGLGLGFVDVDAQEPATPLSARLQGSSFMYQGIIGVSAKVNQRVDMFLDYRYSGSDKLELDAASPIGSLATSVDITSNDIFLGFRFKR